MAAGALTLALSPAEAAGHRKRAAVVADAGQPLWKAQPQGPVIIVVSIADQRLTLYDNGVEVAHSVVSTGIPGHLTPRGVFTIIQKDRNHHSNIYSNAPMPYMQRITWSGVALHEGHVTGRQASHGCIRMPHDIAARLWPYTKIGMRVIVANGDVKPEEFAHPKLFTALKPATTASAPVWPQMLAQAETGRASDAQAPAEKTSVAEAAKASATEASAEHPGFVYEVMPATAALDRLAETPAMAAAPPALAPVALAALPPDDKAAPAAPVAPEPIVIPPGSGHVAMFISKKTGKLYVRREFAPVFETPVVIRDAARPLGSHLYTAMDVKDGGATVRWTVVDVPDATPAAAAPRHRKGEPPVEPVAPLAASSSAEALDRVIISDEARVAIAALIEPGVSLLISDQGFGRETGKGTDFILLTP